jgi:hypothetical protein
MQGKCLYKLGSSFDIEVPFSNGRRRIELLLKIAYNINNSFVIQIGSGDSEFKNVKDISEYILNTFYFLLGQ